MKMTENDYIAEYVKEKMPEIIHTFDFTMWKMMRSFKNFAEKISKIFKKGEDEDDQECGHRPDVCGEGSEDEEGEDTYSEWSGWNSETDET